MPKLEKSSKTVKLFLLKICNEIFANADCCPKKTNRKIKTFKFSTFFQCSTLWFSGAKIRLILTPFDIFETFMKRFLV